MYWWFYVVACFVLTSKLRFDSSKKYTYFFLRELNSFIFPTEHFHMDQIFEEFKPLIDGFIKEKLPEEFTQESMTYYCGAPRYAYDTESATKSLLVPMWDILNRGLLFMKQLVT